MDSTIDQGVFIGGLGGSGTRVVAAIVQDLGFPLPGELNGALDNLWFTLLFKREDVIRGCDEEIDRSLHIFLGAMTGRMGDLAVGWQEYIRKLAATSRQGHDDAWLNARADSLIAALRSSQSEPMRRFAWKEPNSHFVAGKLLSAEPAFRYIHVTRSGLDMAASSNMNQLKAWGPFLGVANGLLDTSAQLRFWRKARERLLATLTQHGHKFVEVSFDVLCEQPAIVIKRLADYCGVPISDGRAESIARARVRKPASIGRGMSVTSEVDAGDMRYANEVDLELRGTWVR